MTLSTELSSGSMPENGMIHYLRKISHQARGSVPLCVSFTTAFVQEQPTARDRQIKAGPVFRRCSFVAEQERAVEFFDVDAAILHRLEGVRVL